MGKLWRLSATALAAAWLVTACGSGDDPAPAPQPDMSRGALLSENPTRVMQASSAQWKAQLEATANGQNLLAIGGEPTCGIQVYEFEYATVGVVDEATNATGAIMAPLGDSAACSGQRPVVLYAHGTTTERDYNIADIANTGEGALIAAMYAAQGFVVVAPNYAGYDKSKLDYHPYLHRDQQSKDMIDALAAARKALARLQIQTSEKLLLSGYSQGGYVAMATHAAMQELGMPVTASAPLSGPYALADMGDAMYSGSVNIGATVFVPMMSTAYQKAYGNIYNQPQDVYEAAYATGIEKLLPSKDPIETIFAQGKLPAMELFSSTSPGSEFDAFTPASPDFAWAFGPNALIKNTARAEYLSDMLASLNGNQTSPQHPMRKALKANDLRDWTPTSPVLMCGGRADPTVFYELNAGAMLSTWASSSPLAPAAGLVQALDVDSAAFAGDPFAAVKNGFEQAKTGYTTQYGQAEMIKAYHGTLVPPFCAAAARGFFQQVLAR